LLDRRQSQEPTTFSSIEEIDRTFRSFAEIFCDTQRVARYFTWLQGPRNLTNSSTLRNYAQLLADILAWEYENSAINPPQLRKTLDKFVIPAVRKFHNHHNAIISLDRRRIRDQKSLRKKGRLVSTDEYAEVPAAAQATFDALYQKAEVLQQRLSPAECELAERALLMLLPTVWAQQRTSILERIEVGGNLELAEGANGQPGAWEYRPALQANEKPDSVRRAPADLRVLPVHQDLEKLFAFIRKHVHPVLLAQANKNKKKDSQSPSASLLELPTDESDRDDALALATLPQQYPLWMVHTGRKAAAEDLRFWYSADFFWVTGMALNPQDARRNMCAFLYSSDCPEFVSELNFLRYLLNHEPIVASTYYSPL
jgi:hypothetical protein